MLILGFVVFSHVFFFDCNSVDIVVCAEGNNFEVRSNVMNNATTNAVNIEVV